MKRWILTSAGLVSFCVTSATFANDPHSAFYSRGSENVFWFMHIADSHIGATIFEGPNDTEHLEYVLNDAVTVIDPTFVVNTGDLVDGSLNDIPAWGQEQAEWDAYKQIYTQAGMTPSFYFDLPGNHDGYDDIGMLFYLTDSMQGQHNSELFVSWTVGLPLGEYYFFGLNTAGNGSGKWFEDPEVTPDELTALETGLLNHASAQLTFALGHHRLDQPDNGHQVAQLLKHAGGGFYLHGHVHSYSEYLQGDGSIVVNQIDTLGKKNYNNIAVAAIDHNSLMYRATDVVAPWPLILITAPASRWLRGNADLNPFAYEVCKDRPDNPVRALVFADETPTEVWVEIGGSASAQMSLAAGSNSLWEAEVDTSSLSEGVHDVTVTVTLDGDDTAESITATFLDGPCDVLPADDTPTGGGGAGGGGSAPQGGAGGQAMGGGTSTGGAGHTAAGGNDTHPIDTGLAGSPFTDEEGGCGCRLAAPTNTKPLLLGLLALGAWGLRSRRRHRNHTAG